MQVLSVVAWSLKRVQHWCRAVAAYGVACRNNCSGFQTLSIGVPRAHRGIKKPPRWAARFFSFFMLYGRATTRLHGVSPLAWGFQIETISRSAGAIPCGRAGRRPPGHSAASSRPADGQQPPVLSPAAYRWPAPR